MTAFKNYYARAFSKLSPSRYPSRTLRDCRVFNKVGNESFLEPLETHGNATGDVAKLLCEISHCRGSPYSKQTIGCFTLAQMGLWWLKALNCKGAFA